MESNTIGSTKMNDNDQIVSANELQNMTQASQSINMANCEIGTNELKREIVK